MITEHDWRVDVILGGGCCCWVLLLALFLVVMSRFGRRAREVDEEGP